MFNSPACGMPVLATYICLLILAVRLPLLKRPDGRTGRSLQPGLNNLLTLNLIVCRKRQLNLKRISLLKRKAQHRRKRLQRKKDAKLNAESPVHSTGILSSLPPLVLPCGCRCCVFPPLAGQVSPTTKQHLGNYVTGRNATIELLLRVYPERSRRALLYANNSSSNN